MIRSIDPTTDGKMTRAVGEEVLRFAGFTADLRRGCLRSADGAEVALAPKPFDLLCVLLRQPGRTVSKDALLDAVWPGLHVTEASLFQAVGEVRRAIGDEKGQLLRSVRRRGYLLDAEVTAGEAAVSRALPPALVPPDDRPSLVVLPFANLSGDPQQDYFADGMVEDITAALARIRWFFVIARNSAFTYRGRAVDVRQIGRELGVRYVLEGSVRKSGDRVRVAGQLAEAETGRQIWSERFDAPLADIFDLQDRVTEAVAGAIEPSLQAAEIRRSVAKPTGILAAYDLYLRALPHHYALTEHGSDAAIALLRQAVSMDPDFSLAKALGAFCHWLRATQHWPAAGAAGEGERWAREALGAAGDDPATLRLAAHATVVLARDFDAGLAGIARALALNPNSAQVILSAAWVHNYACLPGPAIQLFHRAMRLSPLDPEMAHMICGIAVAYLIAGEFEEALSWGLRSTREAPAWATGHRAVVIALAQLGRDGEAREAAAAMLRAIPNARIGTLPQIYRDAGFAARYADGLKKAGLAS